MIEEGVVTETRNGKIIVNIERSAACGSCKACGMKESALMELELENTVGAVKGDKVKIELDDLVILKSAFLTYGAPLTGLMLGIYVGANISTFLPREITSALFGIGFMLVTLLGIKRYSFINKERYKPRIVKP